jgi:RNA polymerase sigma factor (sigma-70 family)
MACRILGQREEAEDVLQEVFMSVHAHLHGFRGESKLSTWLYTIALNRVRNQIRRRGKRHFSSIDAGPEETANSRELPEKGPSVEEIVAQKRDSNLFGRPWTSSGKLSAYFYSALLPTPPIKRGRPATRKTAGNNQSLSPPRAQTRLCHLNRGFQ